MNKIIIENNIKTENMIYEIRGKQVMLDSDLAKLYGYNTKKLIKEVHNNIDRFSDENCFQLTEEECEKLNILCTSDNDKYPYVFDEYGAAMLSFILEGTIAAKISVHIIDTIFDNKRYFSNDFLSKYSSNNSDSENLAILKQFIILNK